MRKVWIAILAFAIFLHGGVGLIVAYATFRSPHPYRYGLPWGIVLVLFVFVVMDCIALHRRILNDDNEAVRLRL